MDSGHNLLPYLSVDTNDSVKMENLFARFSCKKDMGRKPGNMIEFWKDMQESVFRVEVCMCKRIVFASFITWQGNHYKNKFPSLQLSIYKKNVLVVHGRDKDTLFGVMVRYPQQDKVLLVWKEEGQDWKKP